MRTPKFLDRFLASNLFYKILAFFITLFLWAFVMLQDDAAKVVSMPLKIQVPNSYTLIRYEPQRIEFELRGTRKLMERYISNRKEVVIQIHTEEDYIKIPILEERLSLPFGLRALDIKPGILEVQMQMAKEEMEFREIQKSIESEIESKVKEGVSP